MHDAKNEIRSSQVGLHAGDIAKQAAEVQKGVLKDVMKVFDDTRQAFEDARQALAQAADQVQIRSDTAYRQECSHIATSHINRSYTVTLHALWCAIMHQNRNAYWNVVTLLPLGSPV